MLRPTGIETTSTTLITNHRPFFTVMQVRFAIRLKKKERKKNPSAWIKTKLEWKKTSLRPIHPTCMGVDAEVWVRQGAQLERKGKKSFFCHNFDQVVVVAYYWPRGNRPDQVIFSRANEMIFTFFLFPVSQWSDTTCGSRGGANRIRDNCQNTKLNCYHLLKNTILLMKKQNEHNFA